MGREFSSFIFPSNSINPQIPGQSFQRANPMSLAQQWSVVVAVQILVQTPYPFHMWLSNNVLTLFHTEIHVICDSISTTILQAAQILILTFNMYSLFLTPSRLRKKNN